ncbi:DNA-binding transcriptional regulator BolA-like [Stegodyphus dumicola]|uniref:DNA-binding transcriptional regulator BolA-like n=1 Tax=Stegodyphus dumicola TaxID=202533 RepID=UPI0015B06456|nr:DNA-binding transcriptional regulator BolA-like [Stegodyphus dumicola]
MSLFSVLKLPVSVIYQRSTIVYSLTRLVKSASYSNHSAEDFIENVVKQKLNKALEPEYLDVVNESARHNVPRGSASHVRVTVVSPLFINKSLVQRHRLVNEALQEELKGPIHALSIDAIATTEIKDKIEQKTSPPCKGGSGL